MSDPELTSVSFGRLTLCWLGCHTFIWEGASSLDDRISPNHPCSCGRYTWGEWERGDIRTGESEEEQHGQD